MADLYPFAAGNWSTNSNWYNAATGTTVNRQPTTGDNVWLNNKTIVVDTTITCDKLSNKAFTGAGFSPVVGGSATVTLTNLFYPTITIGSGGIESSQATTAGNTLAISGTSTTGSTSSFQILCSGDIIGGYLGATSSHAIYITATNTKITITSNNISGGVTSNLAAAIYNNGAGNTIYINNTTLISGSTAAAIISASLTGSLVIKSTTITGGSSFPAILFRANGSNSSTQYIGYTWNFATNTETASTITDINASATAPAIQSIHTTGSDTYSTTPILVQVTNLNGSSQGYIPILSFNAKITATNIKYYNTAGSLVTYQNQTPSATTVTEASIWTYATRTLTAATNITSDGATISQTQLARLDATVSSRASASNLTTAQTDITAIKTKTDNLPSDPASNTQVNTRLATSGYTAPDNTSITAIKAKTDNLPTNTTTEFSTINTKLDTIDDYLDTEIAAIKTATDRIPTNPASVQSTGDQIATLQ